MGKTWCRFCSSCASFASNETFNKRTNSKEGQLNEVVINIIKYRPGSSTSEALLNYITLELKDNSYHSLIKSYPALGQILEAVEANRLKDWIRKCTTFMTNKTMNEQRPNTVSIDASMVPHLMTAEKICAKISSFKKVTYIAVYALSAILPELIRSNAEPIGLYFDGAFRDRSWIGETYNNHPYDLGIIMDDKAFFSRKFPIEIGLSNNDQPLINGTDVFHCIKRQYNDNNIDDNSYAQINQMLLQHQHRITVAKLS
ncbi:hypothetical protein RhiirA4_454229 [Rhizophagus irregularis]|uniref:Uncharacterized protein n=1 Tax=Rhizophagus irregularis TaxID=588596 RepID=A0A2I1G2C2_9GLOM|nr:hypothetical protein RhiirA4_454229 [Rhizophagus irregularis]